MVQKPHPRIRKVRGAATLLLLLLVGVVTLVAVFGVARQLRSTQEAGMTLHAATQAQAKAWTGVEIIRQYLLQLGADGKWGDLETAISSATSASPVAIPINGAAGFTANVVAYDSVDQEVTVEIAAVTASGTRATASSLVQVIYRYGGDAPGPSGGSGDFIFRDGLIMSGNIEVQMDAGDAYEIVVIGDFEGTSNISNIKTLRVEGNVDIAGNINDMESIWANGDVRILSNNTGNTSVYSRGNICVDSNIDLSGVVQANGFVVGGSNSTFGDIITIGSTDWSGPQLCSGTNGTDSDGELYGVSLLSGNNTARTITSKKSVYLKDALQTTTGGLNIEGNLNGEGSARASGEMGGSFENSNSYLNSNVTQVAGKTVTISPVEEIATPVSVFNAYDLKGMANYVIKRVGSDTKVEVANINGATDGEYFLRSSNHLCTTASGGCTSPSGYEMKLCAGSADCFDYSSGTFTLKDSHNLVTPGIIFVEGDLEFSGEGTYSATFIASGDIDVIGNHTIYAANFAGYDSSGPSPRGICVNTTNGNYYPTNLCNIATAEYIADFGNGVGNFALMAGSLNPSTNSYQGGDILLDSNIFIYGNILAGDQYSNNSNIYVNGLINAEGNASSGGHFVNSNITFDMRNLPDTFTPMSSVGASCSAGCGEVSVVWSRYL
jgi:hypothetical protein